MENIPDQFQKTIWIVMGHPLQLPLAIAIARYAPPRIACRLVISRHKYWSYIDRTELRRDFADVCFFEPIYHAHTLKALVRALRRIDRKSTRLNSSHRQISYAVF